MDGWMEVSPFRRLPENDLRIPAVTDPAAWWLRILVDAPIEERNLCEDS
jgi:hypothetical protein